MSSCRIEAAAAANTDHQPAIEEGVGGVLVGVSALSGRRGDAAFAAAAATAKGEAEVSCGCEVPASARTSKA
jgi:hypothetical protein